MEKKKKTCADFGGSNKRGPYCSCVCVICQRFEKTWTKWRPAIILLCTVFALLSDSAHPQLKPGCFRKSSSRQVFQLQAECNLAEATSLLSQTALGHGFSVCQVPGVFDWIRCSLSSKASGVLTKIIASSGKSQSPDQAIWNLAMSCHKTLEIHVTKFWISATTLKAWRISSRIYECISNLKDRSTECNTYIYIYICIWYYDYIVSISLIQSSFCI